MKQTSSCLCIVGFTFFPEVHVSIVEQYIFPTTFSEVGLRVWKQKDRESEYMIGTLFSFVFLSHSVSIVILFTFKPDREIIGEGMRRGTEGNSEGLYNQ